MGATVQEFSKAVGILTRRRLKAARAVASLCGVAIIMLLLTGCIPQRPWGGDAYGDLQANSPEHQDVEVVECSRDKALEIFISCAEGCYGSTRESAQKGAEINYKLKMAVVSRRSYDLQKDGYVLLPDAQRQNGLRMVQKILGLSDAQVLLSLAWKGDFLWLSYTSCASCIAESHFNHYYVGAGSAPVYSCMFIVHSGYGTTYGKKLFRLKPTTRMRLRRWFSDIKKSTGQQN